MASLHTLESAGYAPFSNEWFLNAPYVHRRFSHAAVWMCCIVSTPHWFAAPFLIVYSVFTWMYRFVLSLHPATSVFNPQVIYWLCHLPLSSLLGSFVFLLVGVNMSRYAGSWHHVTMTIKSHCWVPWQTVTHFSNQSLSYGAAKMPLLSCTGCEVK